MGKRTWKSLGGRHFLLKKNLDLNQNRRPININMLEDNILKGNLFCLANVDAQKVLNSLDDDKTPATTMEIGRKRKRLDDFTPQEKMIRRKLKNRVAAQNARDRKKERLEHLENIVERR